MNLFDRCNSEDLRMLMFCLICFSQINIEDKSVSMLDGLTLRSLS